MGAPRARAQTHVGLSSWWAWSSKNKFYNAAVVIERGTLIARYQFVRRALQRLKVFSYCWRARDDIELLAEFVVPTKKLAPRT